MLGRVKRKEICYEKKSMTFSCGWRYSVLCFIIIQTTLTNWRRRQTKDCALVLPSDIFLLKYALAASLPEREICDKAMRWKARFNLRLPDLVFLHLIVLPEECSLGAQPAYLANAPGEWKRLMSPISPMISAAITTPQPEAVESVCPLSFISAVSSSSIS